MSTVLGKPRRELTRSAVSAHEKKIANYPMVGLGYAVTDGGEKTLTRYLGVLQKDLDIFSERDATEIEGTLIRDMPTPEMLPLFFEVMNAIHPRTDRRSMLLVGAPGAGKTFMGELAGRVTSDRGAIKVDCTNLNLYELFYETVLDFNSSRRFYDELDKKIAIYNAAETREERNKALNPLSLDILREHLGTAFSEEGGKICVDWEGVKHAHTNEKGEPLDSKECIKIAIEGLKKVSSKEGLDALGGNALGMATQPGVAWRAYQEGRILILDEVNRAKRGTFGILHGFFQLVINEIQECVVRNPMQEKGDKTSESMTFRREDMGAGFYVFMTGNTVEDSDEVIDLPEALSSRIVPQHVPQATKLGWQHRFCQMLTGLPISTLYEAQKDKWERHPEEFTRQLATWRRQGEKREVPEHQLDLLRRWRDVKQATEMLATFFDSASKIINPESDFHKAGSLADILEEIDESFKKETSVDFRKITYFLGKAFQAKPAVRPPEDKNGPQIMPLLNALDIPETPEDIRNRLGTHLSYVILDWIIATSYERGKDSLGNQLIQLAADTGIVDPQLHEGMPSSRRTIADLLNDNPYDSEFPEVRMKLVRDLMCDYLREVYKDEALTEDNDDILPVGVMQRAVEALEAEDEKNAAGLIVFNHDLESFERKPFAMAESVDLTPQQAGEGTDVSLPDVAEILPREALLATLAAPGMRDRNLSALWNHALSNSGVVAGHLDQIVDEALAMAENDSKTGLAATTIMVQSQGVEGARAVPMHVIWNKELDRVLVVGDGPIKGSLKTAFNDSRTVYVDRQSLNAEKDITLGMSHVLGESNRKHKDTIKDALLMRTKLESYEEERRLSLDELLLHDRLDCYLPHYFRAPAPQAA